MSKLKYNPTHCNQTGGNQGEYRFTIEQEGDKMIFIIGLNPSTANANTSDRTMTRVLGFIQNKYNGFVMLNLCSERQTKRYSLPKEQDPAKHKEALKIIEALGKKYPNAPVLLAFGNAIVERQYFKTNLADIIAVLGEREYLQIGELTAKGYPRHPSRASSAEPLTPCNVEKFKKGK